MSRPNSRYETLERMLNSTTLTVQRVTHHHIIEQGQKAFVQTVSEESSDKEKAVQVALEQAESRFARELKSVTSRLRKEKEEERLNELRSQKQYYEKHMAHVSEQRDLLEEARVRELRRQFDMEKDAALRDQEAQLRAEMDARMESVRQQEQRRAEELLRADFEIEKETAVRRAQEECARQKEAELAALRVELEAVAMERLQEQKQAHEEVLAEEATRRERLLEQMRRLLHHNRAIEADFQLLQQEYKRFLDNTEGKFHSSYLLKLRKHGLDVIAQQLPQFALDIKEFTENAAEHKDEIPEG